MSEFLETIIIVLPLWSIAYKLDDIFQQLKQK